MSSTINHLVIVSGGVGSRLASVAGNLPKALIPVGDKPVLQHQLELAISAGIEDVTVFAGYGADKIIAFLGNGSRLGVRARVLVEDRPLGTAGAVMQSLASLPSDFFVMYGDVMLAADLRRLARCHTKRAADFTAVVHPNDHPQDSDLVEVDADGWICAIHRCPHAGDRDFANLVNAAVYVVRRDTLQALSLGSGKLDFVTDVMATLISSGCRVLGYRTTDYIKDMGTPERLRNVEDDWHTGKCRAQMPFKTRPAIFLDRDGTLNAEKGCLRTAQDLELLPGVAPALAALRNAGYSLVVLTNQPFIARGEATEADVMAVNRRLEWELGKEGAYLDGIYVCPHHPDRGFPGERAELKVSCDCRKPATGLFERACRDLQIDPERSWMVGDQTRDIELAKRAGLRSILVRTGVGGNDGHFQSVPDHISEDLADAAGIILGRQERAAS